MGTWKTNTLYFLTNISYSYNTTNQPIAFIFSLKLWDVFFFLILCLVFVCLFSRSEKRSGGESLARDSQLSFGSHGTTLLLNTSRYLGPRWWHVVCFLSWLLKKVWKKVKKARRVLTLTQVCILSCVTLWF